MNKKTEEIILRLRREINRELARCSAGAMPHVCREASTPEGYARIEAAVMGIVAQDGIPVATALANIESEEA